MLSLIFLLITNAVTIRRDKSILFSRIAIQSLILSGIIGINDLNLRGLEKGVGIYGGLFNVTTFSQTIHIFIIMVSAIILILTAFYPRKVSIEKHNSFYKLITSKFLYNKNLISNKVGEQFRIIEYPLIILFIITGAMFLVSSSDLVSIFLSIELQSYGLYIISTLYRDSESATASGLTYFLLGGLSSCFILLGSALLYANSGTTSLDNLYVITSISELDTTLEYMHMDAGLSGDSNSLHPYYVSFYYLNLALIILSVGFLFKVSAAPFHFWSPDVYDGIPTIVTTYVAIIAKISIFAFLLELVYYTDHYFDFAWKNLLLLSSLLSLLIGSILGLTQFRIKKLYAYSTISHVGFILLALTINSVESIQSFIFYLLQYSISNLNAFIILVGIGFSLYLYVYENKKDREDLIDKNNSPIQFISQVKGYFYINPFISLSFAITIFSFVGVPPMIGFFAKQMILSAALDNGYVFMSLVAILTSVIGAGYYLNLIKQIFFYKTSYNKNTSVNGINLSGHVLPNSYYQNFSNKSKVLFRTENITLNSGISGSISIITLLLTLFIFMPEEWLNIISILSLVQFKA